MNEILSNRSPLKCKYNGRTFLFDKYYSTGTIKYWKCDKRDQDSWKFCIHTSVY